MKTCKSGLHTYEPLNYRNKIGCVECRKIKMATWQRINRDKVNAKTLKWRQNNPDKMRVILANYEKDNLAKRIAKNMKRHADKLKRTPKWLTKQQLKEMQSFYIKAKILTKQTGIPHEVDHILPLRGKNLSGLHVPWNLQILTESENIKKSNRVV